MFVCDLNQKLFQTLPGQGWRALIQWNRLAADPVADFPRVTLEPVIAWVTTKMERESSDHKTYHDEVIIAPLVRWPSGRELVLLDSGDNVFPHKFIYLAPDEELSEHHFAQLDGEGCVKEAAVAQ